MPPIIPPFVAKQASSGITVEAATVGAPMVALRFTLDEECVRFFLSIADAADVAAQIQNVVAAADSASLRTTGKAAR